MPTIFGKYIKMLLIHMKPRIFYVLSTNSDLNHASKKSKISSKDTTQFQEIILPDIWSPSTGASPTNRWTCGKHVFKTWSRQLRDGFTQDFPRNQRPEFWIRNPCSMPRHLGWDFSHRLVVFFLLTCSCFAAASSQVNM